MDFYRELLEEFIENIKPEFKNFKHTKLVRFTVEQDARECEVRMTMAHTSDKIPIRLVRMRIRGNYDVHDFKRVVKMILQQWYMERFDRERAILMAKHGGKLPKVLQIVYPETYPDWIMRVYNPWQHTCMPDGGFLQNNPLLFPIQNRPPVVYMPLTTLAKWKKYL